MIAFDAGGGCVHSGGAGVVKFRMVCVYSCERRECDIKKLGTCGEALMIHGAENTIYPKAGLFKTGRNLYDVRVHLKGVGVRFFEPFVSKPCDRITGVVNRVLREESWIYTYIGVEAGEQSRTYFSVKRDLRTPPVVVHVWRIQRAIRGYLERRRRGRLLAVLMGLHSRLGSECLLACVPVDIVEMNIVGMCSPSCV